MYVPTENMGRRPYVRCVWVGKAGGKGSTGWDGAGGRRKGRLRHGVCAP